MSLISTTSAASQKGFQAPDVIQGPVLQARILPSPTEANREFGWSLSLTKAGDRIAIGAPGGGGMFGYVWVFSRSVAGWSQETVVSRGNVNDAFGISVSLSGDGNYLAVGANGQNSAEGRVHLYSRSGTTWSYMGVVGGGGESGYSVSLNEDGTYLVIGEPSNDTGSPNRGRVQIYFRTGSSWALQQTLLPDNITELRCGSSVSINNLGTKIIVGNRGSVIAYPPFTSVRTGNTWSALQAVGFGAATFDPAQHVSISGDENYMAASWKQDFLPLSTKIYNPGTTVQATIAVPDTPIEPGRLGFVSLDDTGTNLLQGDRLYTRSNTSWVLQTIFIPRAGASGAVTGPLYGSNTINDDGTYKAFGAPRETINGLLRAGAVYIFV
jgi:hypothetical protein